jgi:transaldolase
VDVVSQHSLTVRLFADGADLDAIRALAANPLIKGFTTNPTLMRQAGVTDYASFSKDAIDIVGDRPISLEVFSDEFDEMERQARMLASWGANVYVKIPITNTRGESSLPLVARLSADGVQVNVTALMTLEQVARSVDALGNGAPACISVFAGRIADAGLDPIPTMQASLALMAGSPQLELIWASPRELLNVVQADQIGCHIITATPDILKKLPTLGKDLIEYSLDTVKMFANDAQTAGFLL